MGVGPCSIRFSTLFAVKLLSRLLTALNLQLGIRPVWATPRQPAIAQVWPLVAYLLQRRGFARFQPFACISEAPGAEC